MAVFQSNVRPSGSILTERAIANQRLLFTLRRQARFRKEQAAKRAAQATAPVVAG